MDTDIGPTRPTHGWSIGYQEVASLTCTYIGLARRLVVAHLGKIGIYRNARDLLSGRLVVLKGRTYFPN